MRLFVHVSVCLCVCLSVCLSVCLWEGPYVAGHSKLMISFTSVDIFEETTLENAFALAFYRN